MTFYLPLDKEFRVRTYNRPVSVGRTAGVTNYPTWQKPKRVKTHLDTQGARGPCPGREEEIKKLIIIK